MPILMLQSELNLHTRCENQIKNEIDRRDMRPGDVLLSEDCKLKYPKGIHRPTQPSRKYNCHGLTFASRRTWIYEPEQIKAILKDDEYREIELKFVMAGDVIVYSTNGDADHSGIVVYTGKDGPIILSKWGPVHEVIHRPMECPYADSTEIKYYRIVT